MSRNTQVEKFIDLYRENLKECIRDNPKQYCYGVDKADIVTEKMKSAFIEGSYNHDSLAIKKTCKQLNIKYNRKSLENYFNQENSNG